MITVSRCRCPFHIFKDPSCRRKMSTVIETRINAHVLKAPGQRSDANITDPITDLDPLAGDEILNRTVKSSNLRICYQNQNFQFEESLKMFCRMHSTGLVPNKITYGAVLSACAASQYLCFGKQIYSLVLRNGLFSDGYVCTGLIDLFAKCFELEDAKKVFSEVPSDNVVCWNAIISGCIKNNENLLALELFCEMVNGFCLPNGFTCSSVLTACTAVGELEMGRDVHGCVIKYGLEDDIFVGTAIVDLYTKWGDANDAVKEFSQMPTRNVVSWTAIISGFVQKEDSYNALRYFKEMKVVGDSMNNYTITSVLAACAKPAMATEGSQLHCLIVKAGFSLDQTVKDALINMYAKSGNIEYAKTVFRETEGMDNVRSWAVMISGFAQNERANDAILLFERMFKEGLKPDKFSCSSVLSIIDRIDLGQQVYCYIVKVGLLLEISVASALCTMYSKCGCIEEAYEVFKQMLEKDGVSWTSMIAGFAEHGYSAKAFQLFREMIHEKEGRPDQTTLAAVLTACAASLSLRNGRETHGHALRIGLVKGLVGGALVNMYSKCKSLVSAKRILKTMVEKDLVAWSSLIAGYSQNGYSEEAIDLFHNMVNSGMKIDCFTISSVLGALGNLMRPASGKQLHSYTLKTGLQLDQSVSSSLITMYSKCGSIADSLKLFDQIETPDHVTWTAMIVSYAQHGLGLEALRIFEAMRERGFKPDSVTFVGVLSACSHTGLVEEGYFYLNSMVKDYGIMPNSHHYACMVDLLSRAGKLEDAKNFICSVPVKPDYLLWGALLSACRLQGNVQLGRFAYEKMTELDPTDDGAYILLSNIYADLGDWKEVAEIRSSMKDARLNKQPAWSSL